MLQLITVSKSIDARTNVYESQSNKNSQNTFSDTISNQQQENPESKTQGEIISVSDEAKKEFDKKQINTDNADSISLQLLQVADTVNTQQNPEQTAAEPSLINQNIEYQGLTITNTDDKNQINEENTGLDKPVEDSSHDNPSIRSQADTIQAQSINTLRENEQDSDQKSSETPSPDAQALAILANGASQQSLESNTVTTNDEPEYLDKSFQITTRDSNNPNDIEQMHPENNLDTKANQSTGYSNPTNNLNEINSTDNQNHQAEFSDKISDALQQISDPINPSDINQTNTTVATTNTDIKVPVTDTQWGNQLAERIMWFTNQNIQTAQIQINPPELGPISAHITFDNDNNANISFLSHHAFVRDAIESSIPKLNAMFESGGVNLGSVNVGEQNLNLAHYRQYYEQQQGQAALSRPDSVQTTIDGVVDLVVTPISKFTNNSRVDFYA